LHLPGGRIAGVVCRLKMKKDLTDRNFGFFSLYDSTGAGRDGGGGSKGASQKYIFMPICL
jgi:hypothetical protein